MCQCKWGQSDVEGQKDAQGRALACPGVDLDALSYFNVDETFKSYYKPSLVQFRFLCENTYTLIRTYFCLQEIESHLKVG